MKIIYAVCAVSFCWTPAASQEFDLSLDRFLEKPQASEIPPLQSAPAGIEPRFNLASPSNAMTPGILCSPSDPNYSGTNPKYKTPVPLCVRNIPDTEKQQVAQAYGVAWADRANYEFDHRIPLCMGGSDDYHNLWPQPLAEAKQKDQLEDGLCAKLEAGLLTQAQAVQDILAWPNPPPATLLASLEQ